MSRPVRRHHGMTVPPFFHAESAEAFHMFETEPTDVVLSSLVKGGTTWCHTLLWSLLHRFNDAGNSIEGGVGGMGQVYPDALPLVRPPQPPMDAAEAFRRNVCGDGCFDGEPARAGPLARAFLRFGLRRFAGGGDGSAGGACGGSCA